MSNKNISYHLAGLSPAWQRAEKELIERNTCARLCDKDPTLWGANHEGIANRLGWLDSPKVMTGNLAGIKEFAAKCRQKGLTKALLMGMGGSSLAPEVLAKVFGAEPGFLELSILDSTDPAAVLAAAETHDPATTLHLVCSKSGGTIEPLSFFKFFYNRAVEALGRDGAGAGFAAITDPGSGLAQMAVELGFGNIFLNDPNIGGRYSALSFFGLAPGGLLGLDLERLLVSAKATAESGLQGLRLGAALGSAASSGRDKLTLVTSPALAPFGDWVEQLIAESTGKSGRGILPVVGEPRLDPDKYGSDRLFVSLNLAGDKSQDQFLAGLVQAGQPLIKIELTDVYALGGQFLLWEVATAVAGMVLGINPFDQPDVEAAKIMARKMMAEYEKNRVLPREEPIFTNDRFSLFGRLNGRDPGQAMADFLGKARPGAYLAIQAYIRATPATDEALARLRLALLQKTGLATTMGYGPRYLHSTGQLHKGDGGQGLFLQLTVDDPLDAAIPQEPGSPDSLISFSVLKAAQALGDGRALISAGRKVIRLQGHTGPGAAIEELIGLIS